MDAVVGSEQGLWTTPRLAQLKGHCQLSQPSRQYGYQNQSNHGEAMKKLLSEEELIEAIAMFGAESKGYRWRELSESEREYWLELSRKARKQSQL